MVIHKDVPEKGVWNDAGTWKHNIEAISMAARPISSHVQQVSGLILPHCRQEIG